MQSYSIVIVGKYKQIITYCIISLMRQLHVFASVCIPVLFSETVQFEFALKSLKFES